MAIFNTYSYLGVTLTDSNCIYVLVLGGSDNNAGTRSAPVATVTKAAVLAGTSKYILLNGYSSENISSSVQATLVIGDTYESGILNATNYFQPTKLKLTNHNGQVFYAAGIDVCNDLLILGYFRTNAAAYYMYNIAYSYINELLHGGYTKKDYRTTNNTVLSYKNYISTSSSNDTSVYNSVIIMSVDLYNYVSRTTVGNYPIFKYCLFRKLTAWKWNGTTITINWNTNPNTSVAYTTETLLDRVYQSLLYYATSLSAGTDKTYFLAILASITTMFYADANGQTNKVVDDVTYPIFNVYNGTTPIDYSLKLDANNVALTMSDTGSYVGAYKANLGGVLFGSIVNVNTDGTDDAVTTPTLLVSDGYNQFSANDASTQSRNRIRTIVQSYPRGKAMAGAGSQLTSGLASRIYFGKKRPMVTSGSGLTIPVETFEVIPYDSLPSDNSVGAANDITGKSTFPRFSVAFNGTTQMWYKANGTPLLFNDLATYSITTDVSLTEYGTWAVTSADAEDYNLSLIATANSLTKKNIPVIYCKQELNLNYV